MQFYATKTSDNDFSREKERPKSIMLSVHCTYSLSYLFKILSRKRTQHNSFESDFGYLDFGKKRLSFKLLGFLQGILFASILL